MAQAAHALSAPREGCNPTRTIDLAAALHHERAAAVAVWAALLPGSKREAKVCRQLLELKARLSRDSQEVRHAC